MGILRHDELLTLHAAMIDANLAGHRSALLAGIDLQFVASLPCAASPAEQIMRDLDAMNGAGTLADGSMPLSTCLANAAALAGGRVQMDAFETARDDLRLRVGGGARRPDARPAPTMPNNLPRRRSFVGRARELEIVQRRQNAGPEATARRWLAIHGLSGAGKTAFALEIAHRAVEQGTHPGGVYWIPADGDPLDRLGHLAEDLRLIGPPAIRSRLASVRADDPAERVARAVQLALQNHPERSLLVLDDLSHASWQAWLPAGLVEILATTRDERLARSPRMRLDALLPDDAVALAREIAGDPEGSTDAAALSRVVSRRFGGLAVAVEHGAMSVREWAGSWSRYEELVAGLAISKEGAKILDEEASESDYPRSVFAAIDLSIQRCAFESPERALLDAAAVFATDAIPFDWAAAAADLATAGSEAQRALKRLEGLGLVRVAPSGASLSIQHLVRWRVRALADGARWLAASRRAGPVVAGWLAGMVDPACSVEVEARRPHIEEALLAAERSGSDVAWFDIATLLGTHLRHRARFTEAHALFEEALQKVQASSPPDDRRLATALSNLGMAERDLGRLERAQALLEQSVAAGVKAYGDHHRRLVARHLNLAMVLRARGHYYAAGAEIQRAQMALYAAQDTRGPKFAMALTAEALLLMDMGSSGRAHLERALAIHEQAHGPAHPEVATALSNLAMELLDQGQKERADELLTRALAINEATYGKDHPKVATTLSNLADVRRALGRTDEARALLRRALTIDEATYGVSSERVVARLFSLARVLQTTDLDDETAIVARALAEDDDAPHLRDRLLESIRATTRWAPRTSGVPLVDRALDPAVSPTHRPARGATTLAMFQTEQRDRAVEIMTNSLAKEALAMLEAVHGPHLVRIGRLLDHLEAELRGGSEHGPRLDEARAAALIRRVSHAYEEARKFPRTDVERTLVSLWDQQHVVQALSFIWRGGHDEETSWQLFENLLDRAVEKYDWEALSSLTPRLVSIGRAREARLVLERVVCAMKKCYGDEDPRTKAWAAKLDDMAIRG